MKKEIVFVADIADDIDDVIAIEYLENIGLLKCVVLDGKSRDYAREKELEKIGVIFETEIPKETKKSKSIFIFFGIYLVIFFSPQII